MNKELEKLDLSMKELYLRTMQFHKDSPQYQKLVSVLAEEYKKFKTLIALTDSGMNHQYYIKYSDIESIEYLLILNGYLKENKKPISR